MHFPYEYVSGVARLNASTWGVEVYLVNRGTSEAMGRVSIIEAMDATGDGVFPNEERFNSGDQFVPAGKYSFSQFQPEGPRNEQGEYGLYWGRIVTTSADLVPSMSFYRPSSGSEPSVVDFEYAPGDFAVFSPSNQTYSDIIVIGPNQEV
jgi:hypothetical protein